MTSRRDLDESECSAVTFRGSIYPQDTETAIADLTQAHFLATCTIPLWLRSCKRCKGAKPADKEFCASCQQKEWDEDAEYWSEERARRYYEAYRMR